MSTFTKLRVGSKPYLAGVTRLTLAVDTATAAVIGSLPAGAVILGAISDTTGASVVTVGATTLTGATEFLAIASDDMSEQANPEIEVTTALASSKMYIEYVLVDSRNGVNV